MVHYSSRKEMVRVYELHHCITAIELLIIANTKTPIA